MPTIETKNSVETEAVAAKPLSLLEVAFAETVDKIAADMPNIMHGSGDVGPSEVNGAAARFLASLTTQYVAKLVDAAVDHFEMFLNQDEPFRVPPPPPFPQNRLPAKPRPLVNRDPPDAVVIMKGSEREPPRKKPKRKMRDEYWDDPLPEPKIRNKTTDAATDATTTTTTNTTARPGIPGHENSSNQQMEVPLEQWVGAMGVDLHAQSIRRAHMPLGLSATNFIFPIYHDVYAYGRVRHMQAAQRGSEDPLLQHRLIQDILAEEKITRFKKVAYKAGAKDGKAQQQEDDDDDDMDDAMDPPSWPGVEELLFPGFRSDWA